MRAKLFGTVAALALIGAASTAQAFDYTPWKWDFDNYTNMYNNEWTWANFYPSGMTVVESFQMYIGDVVATGYLEGDYLPDVNDGGIITSHNPCHFGCGPKPKTPKLSLDDLPNVIEDVSALGIASQITSNVPVYADQTQILLGDYFRPAKISAFSMVGNWFNPIDAAVDHSVSAVAVLSNIELTPDKPYVIGDDDKGGCGYGHHRCGGHDDKFTGYYPIDTNAILQADISQFAYADTTAAGTVFQDLRKIPELGTYKGLGVKGLVVKQTVSAAGLVSTVSNIIDKSVKGTAD